MSRRFNKTVVVKLPGRLSNEERKIFFRKKYEEAALKRQLLLTARRSSQPGFGRTSANFIRAMPNSGETKYNDCTGSLNFGSAVAGGFINLVGDTSALSGGSLCMIPQGTTQNERIGNKLRLKNIRVHGYLSLGNQGSTGTRVRVMLVQDLQANGSMPAVADIMEKTVIDSFINMDNVTRFKVIKDRWVDLNPTSGDSANTSLITIKNFKMNHKAFCRIDYSSTTGAISELKSANYMLLVFAQANLTGSFNFNTRVTFDEQ